MNYNIENFKAIRNKEDKSKLEKTIELFVSKLAYIPKKYVNSDEIDIFINEVKDKIEIQLLLRINNKTIKQTDIITDFDKINDIFNKFYNSLNSELESARSAYSMNKKNSFMEAVFQNGNEYSHLSEGEKHNLFKSLITSTLPDMIGYIKRRVYSARLANIRQFNNIFVKDVVSEVIIRVYDRFQSDIKHIRDFNLWNIKESDAVLNEILEDENFTATELSYEQLVNRELDELEENYSIDGDGDLTMNEDLEEEFSPRRTEHNGELINSYINNLEIVEKIENPDDDFSDKIFDELIKLPLKYQSIYDLYYFEQMEMEDIAKVKNMEPIEIEAILISIRELITENI